MKFSDTQCKLVECNAPIYVRGYCRLHYNRLYKHGSADWQPKQVKGISRKRHTLYNTWLQMNRRCYSKTSVDYQRYGGRGITVDSAWRGWEGFTNFVQSMGDRPVGTSLDRIDNDREYSPANCKWSTRTEQARNTRSVKNATYIHKRKNKDKWVVIVKGSYIGFFSTFDKAIEARDSYAL